MAGETLSPIVIEKGRLTWQHPVDKTKAHQSEDRPPHLSRQGKQHPLTKGHFLPKVHQFRRRYSPLVQMLQSKVKTCL